MVARRKRSKSEDSENSSNLEKEESVELPMVNSKSRLIFDITIQQKLGQGSFGDVFLGDWRGDRA